LYVEDNPSNTKLVSSILARHNDIKLVTADSARTGLKLACDHAPDLILMDINLPDMDGFEALAQISATEWGAKLPVVAVTADAMHSQVEAAGAAGFTDYVTKPLDVPRFLNVVRALLESRNG
jgi:CheY-like chemotaxis protein